MSVKRIAWVEGAIVAALAMALSFIPHFMGWFSPSFGAIVLVVFALRRGLYPALFSGLVWGILHFVLGKVVYLSFSQVILEYIVAFGVMGFAGLLHHQFQSAIRNEKQALAIFYILIASFIGVGIRYFWHFVAGFLFWGKYAPEGVSPYWYSFTVNGIAGLQTLIVTIVVAILLLKYPRIYKER